ncbi:hypothetical protein ACFONL_02045 [Camelimonas fluminis]|uniref:Uncharacterized protein n=1 Tax=Camelimonas fluminis TaxID=1576911 RepID=A0ABV7UD71_9HYPH|nr:hypothetical protein [Camelimonas fluminis]
MTARRLKNGAISLHTGGTGQGKPVHTGTEFFSISLIWRVFLTQGRIRPAEKRFIGAVK